jgi:basic membrane protein A and related proteins
MEELMRTISRRSFNLALVSASAVACDANGVFAADEETKVVLLLSGVISDGGWGQLAYEGIKELAAKPGFKTAYAENISQAQIPQVTRGYADDGYDLIIGHGFEFGSALLEIAPDYPKTKFFVSTFQPAPKIPDNIEFVNLAYLDAAYAAGSLAALSSDKKKAVGFVGGGDNPTQQGMMKAFVAAAERTVPGVKGLGIVTGDYNNAAKGKEAAATMIGNGADVIWHAADVTGLGAIQGAVAGHAKVIGCYSDQTKLAPDSMVTSFVMNLSHMVVSAATSVADGKFAGGTEWKPTVAEMWLLKAGDNGDRNPKLISPENWSAFEKIWGDLGEHKLSATDVVK